MRGRAILAVLAVGALGLVALATTVVFHGTATHPRSPAVKVDVSTLRPAQVDVVDTTLPGQPAPTRIFVTRVPGDGVKAFLATSTHLGCRISWTGEPVYGDITVGPKVAFADPCGGSEWSVDGVCLGGPCPRALDHYAVRVEDGTATVDLTHLVRGAHR